MQRVSEEDCQKTARCISFFQEAVNQLEFIGHSDFNINAALTMILQGRGVTPEAYAITFDEGRAVYEDFQNYHTEDGGALPPENTIVP